MICQEYIKRNSSGVVDIGEETAFLKYLCAEERGGEPSVAVRQEPEPPEPPTEGDHRRQRRRRAQCGADMEGDGTTGGGRRFLYFAACICNLAAFTAGIALGWTSPEIPQFKVVENNPLGQPISKSDEGWIGSLLPIGGMLGPIAAAFAADLIGRKKTLLGGCIPFLVAFGLCIVATNVNYLFLARFLMGLGVGVVFTVSPMYIGEISEDEVRGVLGASFQLFVTLGILFSYCLGPFVTVTIFNIVNLVPPATFLLLYMFLIPESPYFLVQKDDKEAAEKALIKIRNKSKADVQKELDIIKNVVDEALNNKCNFFDIFKSRGLTKALGLSVVLVTFQQLSGINVVLFYAQDIFNDAGVALSPSICTIILGAVQVGASSLCPTLIERKGKRFLLIASCIGSAISEAVLVYFFFMKEEQKADISNIAWLPIASIVAYIVFFNIGLAPIPWAAMGELFPSNIKAVASCCTAVACWGFAFVLTRYFGSVADSIGKAASFGIFSGCCVIAAAFVYKYLPETTGKSLQEIQDILNGNVKGKPVEEIKA